MTQSSLSCYRYSRSFSFCDPPLVRCVEDHGEWRPDLAKQLRIICGIRQIFVQNASAGHWDYAATSRMHTPPLDAETTATLRLHIYPLHLEVLRQVNTCPCQLCFGSSCSVRCMFMPDGLPVYAPFGRQWRVATQRNRACMFEGHRLFCHTSARDQSVVHRGPIVYCRCSSLRHVRAVRKMMPRQRSARSISGSGLSGWACNSSPDTVLCLCAWRFGIFVSVFSGN
jgi:hypothetical protein